MSKTMSLAELGELAKKREAEEAAKPTTKRSKKGARLKAKKTKAKKTKAAAKKTAAAKAPVAKVLRVFIGPVGRNVRSEDRKIPSFVLPLTPALALKRAFALGGTSASVKDSTLPNQGDEPLQLLTLDRFPWVKACKEAVDNPDFPGFVQFGTAVQYLRKGIREKLEELGFKVDMGDWEPPRARPTQQVDPFAKAETKAKADDDYHLEDGDLPPF